jgi:hypothetical protein
MIALAADCLLMRLDNGESVPLSADMISVELMGDSASLLDDEFVRHAAKAVFHYYKHDLGRRTVSVGEFAEAMEKALGGFKAAVSNARAPSVGCRDADLGQLAGEAGPGAELFFFVRLREELRELLRREPAAAMPACSGPGRVVRFRGLRGCVRRLTGARRWGQRCRKLEEQIVAYLRECLSAESHDEGLSLVVE